MASVIVCGTARRLVPPDRALVSLGVSVVANDPASALDQVSDRSAVLARLLGELGVAEADWVTDGVSVAEEWEFRRDTRTLVGHRASTGVSVTVREMAQIAPLLRRAVGEAGGQVRGISWHVDADHPAHRELLGRAAADARQRATAYVEALGLGLGAVELISEAPIDPTPTGGAEAGGPSRMMMKAAAAPMADVAVSGGQIELVAEVHVRFAILARA